MAPLVCPHPCHRSIVVDACIVHEHLNRTIFQNLSQGTLCCLGIADVEAGHAGRSACSNDLIGYLFSRSAIAMRMNNDVQALLRQLPADRGADLTAAACDQGSPHDSWSRYLRNMDARPSRNSSGPPDTRKA